MLIKVATQETAITTRLTVRCSIGRCLKIVLIGSNEFTYTSHCVLNLRYVLQTTKSLNRENIFCLLVSDEGMF